MSGIVSQIGARSGILDSGGLPSGGTVTQSGTTQLEYEEGTFDFNMTIDGTTKGTEYQYITNYIKVGNSVTIAVEYCYAYGDYTGVLAITTSLPFVPLSGGRIDFKHQGLDFEYINFNAGSADLRTVLKADPAQMMFNSTLNDGVAQTYSQKSIVFSHTYITS